MELTVKPFIANMKIHYNSFNKFEIVFRPFFPNLIQLIPNPTHSTSEVKDRREEITTEKNLETNVEEKTKTDRRRKRSNNEEQEELSKKRKTEEKMEISDE